MTSTTEQKKVTARMKNPLFLLWIIGIAAIATVPFAMPTLQLLVNFAMAKGLAVLGVTVLLRAGQVSFGHALYFGVSAYAGAFLMAAMPGADFVMVLLAGTLGAVLAGLFVGLFVVRYRGIFFGMPNLAFSMIFWSILEKFYHYTGDADGIRLARPLVLGKPPMDMHNIPERDAMLHLLEVVGCADMADTVVVELSEGPRKLIDITLALALKPKLILMDEPTSGVASSEKHAIMEILIGALKEANVTSVFVEHDMGIVEKYADEVAVWNSGDVQLRGTPAEILEHPDVIRDVIGEAV